jgi:adenine-specific DNA methylase
MLHSQSFLQALPPYPGGKRRLLPGIFGLIDSVCPKTLWPDLTFADPFLGGGAVALTAKALGFRLVMANDLAARSVIVGRALLENSTAKLSRHDVLSLFQGRNGLWGAKTPSAMMVPAITAVGR